MHACMASSGDPRPSRGVPRRTLRRPARRQKTSFSCITATLSDAANLIPLIQEREAIYKLAAKRRVRVSFEAQENIANADALGPDVQASCASRRTKVRRKRLYLGNLDA